MDEEGLWFLWNKEGGEDDGRRVVQMVVQWGVAEMMLHGMGRRGDASSINKKKLCIYLVKMRKMP